MSGILDEQNSSFAGSEPAKQMIFMFFFLGCVGTFATCPSFSEVKNTSLASLHFFFQIFGSTPYFTIFGFKQNLCLLQLASLA